MNTMTTLEPAEMAASRVLTDLALAINDGPGVRDVQALVVEKAVEALGATAGSVMLPADAPNAMRVAAATGLPATPGPPPESLVADWVVTHNQPLLLIGRTGPLAHLLRRDDIRDAVCVPLRHGGLVLGALSVSNSRHRPPFHAGDVDRLTAIGHLAAVALRNTALCDEAREHQSQLQAVLRRLWTAQEDERRRLATDLHDGPAQRLFHIVFQLQTARARVSSHPEGAVAALEQLEGDARDTLAQVRAIMGGLRPVALDDLGLVPALRNECDTTTARGRIAVQMTVRGTPVRFGSDMENGLFRMTREGLMNAERHSGAANATLDIDFQPAGWTICVRDTGCGMAPNTLEAARQSGHIGLCAVRERAVAFGVCLQIVSQPGHGTHFILRGPSPVLSDPNAARDGGTITATLDAACIRRTEP